MQNTLSGVQEKSVLKRYAVSELKELIKFVNHTSYLETQITYFFDDN